METRVATQPKSELAKYDPKDYNVLLPTFAMAERPEGARKSVSIVTIDVTKDADGKFASGDVYALPGGKVSPTKVALNRLSAAAGVSILALERVDDRSRAHVYGYRARVRIIDPDGIPREGMGTKEIDLSDGGKDYTEIVTKAEKPDKYGKTRDPDSQILEARKFGAEICETKALNRALRQILALKSGYTIDELRRPFVVPRLILDTTDPQAKQAVIQGMMAAQASMYPVAARASAGPDIVAEVETPKQAEAPASPDAKAQAILRDAWEAAKIAGLTGAEFGRICKELSGAEKRDDVTAAGAQAVADAVAVRIAEIEESKDAEVPSEW